MTKSKTNSVRCGIYVFQPTRYDENDNLFCKLVAHTKVFITGVYKFNEEKFEIIWSRSGWLNSMKHQKMLNFFLSEYDWV